MKFLNKSKQIILTGALIILTISSCSRENVIELTPYNSIDENLAFSTPDMINLSVMGMYNAAQLGYYGGSYRGYPFGAAYFEQGDMRGEDMVNTATFFQLTYMSLYDASGSLNNINYWSDTYRLINRTNLIIEGVNNAIKNGVISKADGDSYIGEALFFRAAACYELLKHFARTYNYTSDASHMGIPYMILPNNTTANIETNSKLGRGTVAANYAQLISDLDEAEAKLYSKTKRSAKDAIVRITKEAAIAYKTRVYLAMRKWDKVITEANKLNSSYTLGSTPDIPFKSNYANTESIFSIENTATNNPGVNAGLASMYYGRKLIAISPIIWDDLGWLADDLRRGEGTMVSTLSSVKYTFKYKDATNLSDASPLIRYAEVLLNRAEALARTNNPAYLADLNKVRNRSLANPATQAYTAASFPTFQDAVKAIIKERRIEFLGEGMRWNDISRLQNDDIDPVKGIPAKYANTVPKAADYHIGSPYVLKTSDMALIPTTDYRLLWPIPSVETTINPTLAAQQNPGY